MREQIQELTATAEQQRSADRHEIQHRILLMLSEVDGMITDDIAKRVGIGQQVAEHHLEKLDEADMIWSEKATYGAPLYWQLMPRGRDYLIERDLLRL